MLPERLVVDLKLGLVAIDCHGIGIAIDRDGDLLARVARVSEGKLGLQFVAAGMMLAAHLERKQVFTWNARSHRAALVQHRAVIARSPDVPRSRRKNTAQENTGSAEEI